MRSSSRWLPPGSGREGHGRAEGAELLHRVARSAAEELQDFVTRKLDPQKTVPIIMITTEGSADKVKDAVLAGANNYLAKPFTPDRFKEKLVKILG